MRYRDFAAASSNSANMVPDNLVFLHVRRGEMPRLEALMMTMDISLCGPIRKMPTGNAMVQIYCSDAVTAQAFRAAW